MIDNASVQTITGELIKNSHWEIQYARFFNFPPPPSATTCSFLRPIFPRKKRRLKGTWLSSSSSNVSLHIVFNDHSLPEPTLVVSIQEKIYEEHYISKLRFTWPQGAYASGCSLGESRVIFASYRDGTGQIQKFALRFSSSVESQKFVNVLKWLKEGGNRSSDMAQCLFTEGIDEEHSLLQRPSINQEHDPQSCSEPGVQNHAVRDTDVALPQSFTDLLADCFTETELGVPRAPTEVDAMDFLKMGKVADKFVDLMDKMDTVIIGLGGGLAI